ncbi:hypothetical protein CSKR_201461 [Clonorchis sinensis]|uniref:Uncharacterized protein n=1 Tax=Clonorchis sinensis TaxID=79923 RepID=A0A8T1MRU7_CLOSI|nr:hypothetical protein CSKR_201461 [Clonorchis sinensis]
MHDVLLNTGTDRAPNIVTDTSPHILRADRSMRPRSTSFEANHWNIVFSGWPVWSVPYHTSCLHPHSMNNLNPNTVTSIHQRPCSMINPCVQTLQTVNEPERETSDPHSALLRSCPLVCVGMHQCRETPRSQSVSEASHSTEVQTSISSASAFVPRFSQRNALRSSLRPRGAVGAVARRSARYCRGHTNGLPPLASRPVSAQLLKLLPPQNRPRMDHSDSDLSAYMNGDPGGDATPTLCKVNRPPKPLDDTTVPFADEIPLAELKVDAPTRHNNSAFQPHHPLPKPHMNSGSSDQQTLDHLQSDKHQFVENRLPFQNGSDSQRSCEQSNTQQGTVPWSTFTKHTPDGGFLVNGSNEDYDSSTLRPHPTASSAGKVDGSPTVI